MVGDRPGLGGYVHAGRRFLSGGKEDRPVRAIKLGEVRY